MEVSKNPTTLSLCMIVKDEENNLAGCLESVHDMVDQIVIVDTGSTDRTVEIAKKFGAEIHHFQWCNDFAVARNESIKHAKCDWILWMDADERLKASTSEKLRKCLIRTSNPLCYKVTVRSLQAGDSYHDSDAYRLFSNRSGIYFEGRIHEQITTSARKVRAKEKSAEFILMHYGYNLTDSDMQDKLSRNRKLLKEIVKDNNPNQAYYYFTLGQNYSSTNEVELALEYYEKALSLKQLEPNIEASLLNCTAQACFNLGKYDRVEQLSKRSLELIQMQAGAVYNLFKLSEKQGNNADKTHYLEKLLDNCQYLQSHPKLISSDTLPPIFKVQSILGDAYLETGDKVRALQYYLQAWEESRQESLLQKIIPLAMELGDLNVLRDTLEKSMKAGDSSKENLDLLAVVYIKQQELTKALQIYEQMNALYPDDIHVIKRLVGLYAKTGQTDKVADLLKQLQ